MGAGTAPAAPHSIHSCYLSLARAPLYHPLPGHIQHAHLLRGTTLYLAISSSPALVPSTRTPEKATHTPRARPPTARTTHTGWHLPTRYPFGSIKERPCARGMQRTSPRARPALPGRGAHHCQRYPPPLSRAPNFGSYLPGQAGTAPAAAGRGRALRCSAHPRAPSLPALPPGSPHHARPPPRLPRPTPGARPAAACARQGPAPARAFQAARRQRPALLCSTTNSGAGQPRPLLCAATLSAASIPGAPEPNCSPGSSLSACVCVPACGRRCPAPAGQCSQPARAASCGPGSECRSPPSQGWRRDGPPTHTRTPPFAARPLPSSQLTDRTKRAPPAQGAVRPVARPQQGSLGM
jgi:hypothetical protein